MIVDGARDRRIFSLLRELHLEYYCLYSGPLLPMMETAAPYLLHLDCDDKDTRCFLRHAWGNSWGVFLRCDKSLDQLRQHLRGFLTVQDPGGKRLLFRYYDPRVLRVYLPTCTPGELRTIFGPIERLWMEDGHPGRLLEFGFDEAKLVGREIDLDT